MRSSVVTVVGLGFMVRLSGCAVTVQNRYSVFGFDRLQTDSPDQARAWSIALLAAVVVESMAVGAGGLYAAQQVRRWQARSAGAPEPPEP